jgi:hypothetical protein
VLDFAYPRMSAASAAAAATSASYIISLKNVILLPPINQCHQYFRLHLVCLLHLHCRYQKENHKLQVRKRKKERKKTRNPSISHYRIVANLLQHEAFGGETFLQEEEEESEKNNSTWQHLNKLYYNCKIICKKLMW